MTPLSPRDNDFAEPKFVNDGLDERVLQRLDLCFSVNKFVRG